MSKLTAYHLMMLDNFHSNISENNNENNHSPIEEQEQKLMNLITLEIAKKRKDINNLILNTIGKCNIPNDNQLVDLTINCKDNNLIVKCSYEMISESGHETFLNDLYHHPHLDQQKITHTIDNNMLEIELILLNSALLKAV